MPLSVAGSTGHPVLEGYFGTIDLCSLGVLCIVDHSAGHIPGPCHVPVASAAQRLEPRELL